MLWVCVHAFDVVCWGGAGGGGGGGVSKQLDDVPSIVGSTSNL
jgi:hypothetical protein